MTPRANETWLDRVVGPVPRPITADALALVALGAPIVFLACACADAARYVLDNYLGWCWYVVQYAGIEGPGLLIAWVLTRTLPWLD